MAVEDQGAALASLRQDIDRIDAALHGLLMERGLIIDRLISAKGGASTGSAFRPEREAAMMRVLGGRHRGRLPFDAVEGIWRVIISTFTHVQAPFSVHLADAADAVALRDSARFHFGFTIPLVVHAGTEDALAAVAGSRGDLGLLPVGEASDAAWWRDLEPDASPKVIARLPFVERADHPAGLPVLVVAKTVSGEGLGSVVLFSADGIRDIAGVSSALRALGGEVVAAADGSALLALPREVGPERVAARLGARLVPVGSHPVPVRLDAPA